MLTAVPAEGTGAFIVGCAAARIAARAVGEVAAGEGVTVPSGGAPVAVDEAGAFHHF